MRIVLIGYGRMGRAVEQMALQRGHTIAGIIDEDRLDDWQQVMPDKADAVVEFTNGAAAESNIRRALQQGVPVVSGTTGWNTDSLAQHYPADGTPWIWSSNYSIGVQLFFALNRRAAALLRNWRQYKPSVTETHHIHKLDKPSGTAKTMEADLLKAGYDEVPVESIREGEVAGVHTVKWESDADMIELTHSAKSRAGFALGAVVAAEWIQGKMGVHTMQQLLGLD